MQSTFCSLLSSTRWPITIANPRSLHGDTVRSLARALDAPENCRRKETQREMCGIFATDKAAEHSAWIQAIDKMSSSGYDLLTDREKIMYLESILPGKKERASSRRARFAQWKMHPQKQKDRPAKVREILLAKTGSIRRRYLSAECNCFDTAGDS